MSHEKDILGKRPIWWASIALVITLGLGWAIPTWLQKTLVAERASQLPPPNPLVAEYGATVPPVPRLQVNPDRDIETYRAAEDAQLEGYGWVDPASGTVHIPIERAISITAARKKTSSEGGKP